MRKLRVVFSIMRALTFAVLLAVPAAAAAQAADTLTGRVTDAVGQPIAAATVEITELGRRTTTATDGSFRLALPPGRYTVAVRRSGFAPVVRDVRLSGSVAVDVALTPSPFQLEPVTVTATRSPVAADASPLPFSALAGDQLRRAQGVSLAHVLEALPGLRTLSTGAQIGKPVIRGLSGPRVLVLENGSRLEDYSWSDEDGPSVETGFVRRVEVIRGPASVLYGSDALGGVINVISEQLPDAAGGPKFMRTGYQLSLASNNAEIGLAGRAEGARGTLGWRLAGVGRFASALHTPAGELENTGFGSASAEAVAGWRGPRGGLSVRVAHYGGEFKLLEANGPDTSSTEEGGPERKLGDERLQVRGERVSGSWRLVAQGQFQRHSLIEVSDDTVPGGGGSQTETEAFNLLLQTASLDLLAHHGTGALRGTLGLSGVGQWNDASGRIPLVPDARIASGAAFAFEQLAFGGGRWSLLAGARVDARRLNADADTALAMTAQARNATAWSGDLGIVFRPAADVAVSANVGRAWRAPTLFELFSNGPHLGEARYERGDATLVPEAGRSVDVGVRLGGHRVRLELAAYQHAISDYIYIRPDTVFIDSLRVYQHAQADAELIGTEVSLEAELVPGFTARARLDGVRGTNLTAHEPLPLVPPLRTGVTLVWRDAVQLDVDTYARQDRPNSLDIQTAGYTLVHVSASREITLFGRAMRLDVGMRNAFNTSYRSFLSRYKEFALDPGRNLIIRLSAGDVE
jgi:outer membrane receptor protein involved in Fe transport